MRIDLMRIDLSPNSDVFLIESIETKPLFFSRVGR